MKNNVLVIFLLLGERYNDKITTEYILKDNTKCQNHPP